MQRGPGNLVSSAILASVGATVALAAVGAIGAWILRRHTTISIRNIYLAAGGGFATCALCIAAQSWSALLVLIPLSAAPVTAALIGRRWRLSDLGAGEELRHHELSRRWLWEAKPRRQQGERVWIRGQGEIVHRRGWPAEIAYLSMTGKRSGPKLPRGEGQHVFVCGGSGAGKTTSAQRLAAARVLADHTALLAIDAKGDRKDELVLRRLAARAGVP
jgi:hypothetical protein